LEDCTRADALTFVSVSIFRSVPLQAHPLTSFRTLIPLDYYDGPFCRPETIISSTSQNLGATLQGYRTQSVPYTLQMKVDKYCSMLCVVDLGPSSPTTADDAGRNGKKAAELIRKGYHTNWLVDNLPAASKVEDDETVTTRWWQGVPIGSSSFVENGRTYIHNHLNFEIHFHDASDRKSKDDNTVRTYNVVRVVVEPFSIKHNLEFDENGGDEFNITNPIPSCNPVIDRLGYSEHTNYDMIMAPGHQPQPPSGKVLFTYDVIWIENPEQSWSNRWSIYLNMDFAVPDLVHWYSLANSVICVIILTTILVSGLLCCLRKERNQYHALDTADGNDLDENAQHVLNQGWIAIRSHVFHPPTFQPTLFAVLCGTGAQLFATTCIIITFAAVGFMSSVRPGRLLRGAIVTYACMGLVGGYVSARFSATLKLGNRMRVTILTALGFPGLVFSVFFRDQFGGAVPPIHKGCLCFDHWNVACALAVCVGTFGMDGSVLWSQVSSNGVPLRTDRG